MEFLANSLSLTFLVDNVVKSLQDFPSKPKSDSQNLKAKLLELEHRMDV